MSSSVSVGSGGTASAGGTGEEEALLRNMIEERDRKIEQLNAQTMKYELKIQKSREAHDTTKLNAAKARIDQIQVVEDYNRKIHLYRGRIEAVQKDVIAQNGGLHAYANILKEAARTDSTSAADSSYVVRMQAQLCKAMHSMGVLERQLELRNKYSADLIASCKTAMNDVLEEKTNIEIELMNELMQVDDGRRKMDTALKQSKKHQQELQMSQGNLSDDDDSDDDEEEDSEEEIDEDLLREIMDERKEDIEEIERLNVKQAKEIEELTAKIKALQSS